MDTDTRRGSLYWLPPEMLIAVVEHTPPKDRLSLRLTCRKMLGLTNPALWSHLTIDLSSMDRLDNNTEEQRGNRTSLADYMLKPSTLNPHSVSPASALRSKHRDESGNSLLVSTKNLREVGSKLLDDSGPLKSNGIIETIHGIASVTVHIPFMLNGSPKFDMQTRDGWSFDDVLRSLEADLVEWFINSVVRRLHRLRTVNLVTKIESRFERSMGSVLQNMAGWVTHADSQVQKLALDVEMICPRDMVPPRVDTFFGKFYNQHDPRPLMNTLKEVTIRSQCGHCFRTDFAQLLGSKLPPCVERLMIVNTRNTHDREMPLTLLKSFILHDEEEEEVDADTPGDPMAEAQAQAQHENEIIQEDVDIEADDEEVEENAEQEGGTIVANIREPCNLKSLTFHGINVLHDTRGNWLPERLEYLEIVSKASTWYPFHCATLKSLHVNAWLGRLLYQAHLPNLEQLTLHVYRSHDLSLQRLYQRDSRTGLLARCVLDFGRVCPSLKQLQLCEMPLDIAINLVLTNKTLHDTQLQSLILRDLVGNPEAPDDNDIDARQVYKLFDFLPRLAQFVLDCAILEHVAQGFQSSWYGVLPHRVFFSIPDGRKLMAPSLRPLYDQNRLVFISPNGIGHGYERASVAEVYELLP